ncbi:6-phosphogluconolactonase [Corticibacterium sp. UT-5YL-CI-8]|nr:6-phosphogluconolactonase [Tianweitania sp. UT-5YL-CI-8]
MADHEPMWTVFDSRETLAETLAEAVAAALEDGIDERGRGLLAVSGGSTPARFMQALSRKPLDWSKVTILQVDERFVPETSPRSNAGLAKTNLLQDEAAAASFVTLYRDVADVSASADSAEAELATLPWPLDAAILGMGPDGHTASFFPDAKELPQLLDPAGTRSVMAVHAESAGEPRLTLTLPRLVSARFLALHIEGEEKRFALEAALAAETVLPIRAVIENAVEGIEIFWAP